VFPVPLAVVDAGVPFSLSADSTESSIEARSVFPHQPRLMSSQRRSRTVETSLTKTAFPHRHHRCLDSVPAPSRRVGRHPYGRRRLPAPCSGGRRNPPSKFNMSSNRGTANTTHIFRGFFGPAHTNVPRESCRRAAKSLENMNLESRAGLGLSTRPPRDRGRGAVRGARGGSQRRASGLSAAESGSSNSLQKSSRSRSSSTIASRACRS
jgi:hypothetical protein